VPPQRCSIDDVELHVMPTKCEVTANQVPELLDILFPLQQTRKESKVEQCPPDFTWSNLVMDDHGRRAMRISPMRR